MPSKPNKPQPSAISSFISSADTKSPREALALEIFHNLRYQHRWTDLKLHSLSPPPLLTQAPSDSHSQSPNRNKSPTGRSKSPARDDTIYLISGQPPRTMYVHPDLQKRMLRDGIDETAVEGQREWVIPLSVGEKWTLKRFCHVFNGLPEREPVRVRPSASETTEAAAGATTNSESNSEFEWKDNKRVILGMLAHNGMGGDGTVAYYIVQEGEVKPRQNG
ncbi:hypothetical protein H2198_000451 [Neophaeococcomyces mojaviensis]|uniref:Uncharacterized protein n=1 Tax=Neophaeococcomyces mojaviensis TaxID=3383035 RepID=A0ACC3AK44_9EURO|nr:hypothetical protein H2198_000451 [Knufia sp. JES_112]